MIELKNPDFFSKAVGAIASFISEGNFRFNEKGISFRAIDASQIVLVDYFLPKKVFDKYKIEPSLVGLDLKELDRIFSRAMQKDKLTIELAESEIIISLEGDFSRHFTLPLMDLSEQDVNLPEPKEGAKVTMPARILKEGLKDAALFNSSIILKVNGKDFFIEAKGSSGSFNASAKDKSVKVISKKDVVAKYSLNFLSAIVREADNEQEILLSFDDDSPMLVTYPIGESEIKFYLAPMVL